jgi:peptidoglycan/xylan/chitin deacetylase (PgdA/CDA1 family)
MSTSDHRTPGSAAPLALGAFAGAATVSYLGVALVGPRPVIFPRSPAPIWPALRRALGVEDRTASGRGYALTFDDGPHIEGTPAALEILAAAGVQATFFLVGEQVRHAPALAREILAAGHEIGLHCDRHRNLLRLAPWQVRDDIARALASIEEATGHSPTLYRPPYGVLNAAALRQARGRGWRTLMWTQWGRDWEARATPESIAARVTEGAGEGSVLLLHDADDYSAPGSWRRTVAALPRVLDVLAERGLHPVAL